MRLALGFNGPRQPVLGSEFAGEVIGMGAGVTRFRIGDKVFGMCPRLGAHAEQLVVSERAAVAAMPSTLAYHEAAALPFGATTMLDFYRRARLVAGEHVLVNGASGAVGVAAVQLAVAQGATVTAVCSAANAALVRQLGAAQTVDYSREDFAAAGPQYDVIVDAIGNAPFARSRRALRHGGRLLAVVADLAEILAAPLQSRGGLHVIAGPVTEREADAVRIAELAASGALRPVIDRRLPFNEIPAAHRYVDTGRKRGSVVIDVLP
jgi:NADPH:quinone reductase-like Zn-dependent oxidoreductase